MPFLIKALIILPVFCFTIAHKLSKLWKAGLIGVMLVLVTDSIGYIFNLYLYKNGFIMISGIPIIHIFNMFLVSMMFVYWLPDAWLKRFYYITYLSAVFLAVEAIMHVNAAIVYPNWQLWYSYILMLVGLSLLAYLSDFTSFKKERSFIG